MVEKTEKRYQGIWSMWHDDEETFITVLRLGGHNGWDTLAEAQAEIEKMTWEDEDYPELISVEDTWANIVATVENNTINGDEIFKTENEWQGKDIPVKA